MGVPDPVVPAELYGEAYFLTANWGHEEWAASEGAELSPIYAGVLRRAGLRPGEHVVDLGCGRGEMVVAALQAGAASATGVEYSESAIALATRTLEQHDLAGVGRLVMGDVRQTSLPDGGTDLVTMVDVVEHLSAAELATALREARRLLRPGGRIIIHTMPNRWLYSVTYRLQRGLRPDRWRRWPKDPRHEYERTMHVNEQTRGSLRRVLRQAHFAEVDVSYGQLVYGGHLPDAGARRTIKRLASRGLTAPLAIGDLWATARRPPESADQGR